MKKILLFVIIIIVLFGYMTYSRLHSQGWTFFSPADTEVSATTTLPSSPELTTVTPPLLFAGDIMLGRYVETIANASGDELHAFRSMQDYLKQHVAIANLEGPIPDKYVPTPINGFSFAFPPSSPRLLKEGGITAVTLANNHMFDKGREGYEQTKEALDRGGVFHFGGYAPTEDDYFETKLGTTTVIVYGITMIATGWDETQAIEVTKKLRGEHPDAYLIAFLHWGDEYKTQNRYQRAFAHSLIDNGVDAILGSHSHVVQGVEVYDNKPIFYSLGNFIFDQWWRNDLEDGLMVRISDTGKNYTYELVPIRESRSVPSIAASTTRDRILSDVSRQSDALLKVSVLQGSFTVPK